jgi:hypothetical protein
MPYQCSWPVTPIRPYSQPDHLKGPAFIWEKNSPVWELPVEALIKSDQVRTKDQRPEFKVQSSKFKDRKCKLWILDIGRLDERRVSRSLRLCGFGECARP